MGSLIKAWGRPSWFWWSIPRISHASLLKSKPWRKETVHSTTSSPNAFSTTFIIHEFIRQCILVPNLCNLRRSNLHSLSQTELAAPVGRLGSWWCYQNNERPDLLALTTTRSIILFWKTPKKKPDYFFTNWVSVHNGRLLRLRQKFSHHLEFAM